MDHLLVNNFLLFVLVSNYDKKMFVSKYTGYITNQMIMLSIYIIGDEFCPEGQYKPEIDKLNAAQSGARSLNLNHEIDYVLDQLDDAYDANLIQPQDWKLLTLFIGSNDICHSCTTLTSLPPPFLMNVAAAIERIRLTIRNVFVQIGKVHNQEKKRKEKDNNNYSENITTHNANICREFLIIIIIIIIKPSGCNASG